MVVNGTVSIYWSYLYSSQSSTIKVTTTIDTYLTTQTLISSGLIAGAAAIISTGKAERDITAWAFPARETEL